MRFRIELPSGETLYSDDFNLNHYKLDMPVLSLIEMK